MASKRWADVRDAEEFFAGDPLGVAVFHRVSDIVAGCGGAELRVAATQIGWARRRGFVFIWSAARWLGARGAGCVLTVSLPHRADSPRWKQVAPIRPGLWNHHLEIGETTDIDDEVADWISAAYAAAG